MMSYLYIKLRYVVTLRPFVVKNAYAIKLRPDPGCVIKPCPRIMMNNIFDGTDITYLYMRWGVSLRNKFSILYENIGSQPMRMV